jgi:hypothetical protein
MSFLRNNKASPYMATETKVSRFLPKGLPNFFSKFMSKTERSPQSVQTPVDSNGFILKTRYQQNSGQSVNKVADLKVKSEVRSVNGGRIRAVRKVESSSQSSRNSPSSSISSHQSIRYDCIEKKNECYNPSDLRDQKEVNTGRSVQHVPVSPIITTHSNSKDKSSATPNLSISNAKTGPVCDKVLVRLI